MYAQKLTKITLVAIVCLAVAGCGRGSLFGDGVFSGGSRPDDRSQGAARESRNNLPVEQRPPRSSILDLFANNDDPNITLEVNKYIWNASLEILDFMPVQAADPFSGVIVYGFGAPPGTNRAYRATVFVQDPALDARSLRVALATRAGPASPETVRAIEDAILTRARQLRIRDGDL
jgi:hypothetical protein